MTVTSPTFQITLTSNTLTSVLVANRGEIACRIIRTLRDRGIRSIAVYSDADRDARHVRLADVAVRIGPAAPQHSYLDAAAIVAAALAAGADAVHPGYGFLSESAEFARACRDAGLVFIGPGTEALEVMGDKIAAKAHVSARGVPVIPGFAEADSTDERLIAAAVDVGYPMLIKPSAGGGGKGMTVVERAEDLPTALVSARRIATAAFGDDSLFLERLVPQPRHIEVQVLADEHGSTIHLGERECSLQRRHQKIIEEAPSPLLDDQTRQRIGEAACEVARSVGYVGAGTVEFLVSAANPGEFFFMEMNTRLQVEHPVTEAVTGVDLVDWQLRIAAGEPLSIDQADVVLTGHAIEARLYAEDPATGFLPSTGTVLALSEPAGDGIRVDSSLLDGLVIPADYDPMLAKIIAWGSDRTQARARLDRALADTTVLGVHTNLEFLRALLADDGMQAGRLDTGLIERALPHLRFAGVDDAACAAAALTAHGRPSGAWAADGWRIGAARPARYSFEVVGGPDSGRICEVLVGHGSVTVDGVRHSARLGSGVLELDGISRRIVVRRSGESIWVRDAHATHELVLRNRARQLADHRATLTRAAGAPDPDIRTSMPGTVVAIAVASGDTVEAGQVIVTIEAMKMEHALTASMAGTVSLATSVGAIVATNQVVARIGEAP